jgi:hypothetical protein
MTYQITNLPQTPFELAVFVGTIIVFVLSFVVIGWFWWKDEVRRLTLEIKYQKELRATDQNYIKSLQKSLKDAEKMLQNYLVDDDDDLEEEVDENGDFINCLRCGSSRLGKDEHHTCANCGLEVK